MITNGIDWMKWQKKFIKFTEKPWPNPNCDVSVCALVADAPKLPALNTEKYKMNLICLRLCEWEFHSVIAVVVIGKEWPNLNLL